MTNPDWLWKGLLCLFFLLHQIHVGVVGRHYDKCLTQDDRQGVCVVKRYCREASTQQLLPCDGDEDSYCCPIPTTARSARPVTYVSTAPAGIQPSVQRPANNDRPINSYPPEDGRIKPPPRKSYEDEPSKKHLTTYDRPAENPREDRERLPDFSRPEATNDRPRNHYPPEDGRNRPPIHRSYEDELPKKPLRTYDRPEINPYDDRERLPDLKRPADDRLYNGRHDRPMTNGERRDDDRPVHEDRSVPHRPPEERTSYSYDNNKRRPHQQPPDYPRETPSSRPNRDRNSNERKELSRPSHDNESKYQSQPDFPRHYPAKEIIDTAREIEPPRTKPARHSPKNSSAEASRAPIKFPDTHELSLTQPKVPACGVKPYDLFIAGGEESDEHEWPWMTAIFRRHQDSRPKTFLCGGSLINTKYVLTAAHCFVHNYVILPASSFVVRLGSHYLSSGEEYTVSNLVIHQNHSGSDFFNDIALVRLASEVYVTDKIAPICLPFPDMIRQNLVGRMATVSGWGDTAFRTGGTRALQHVTVPIVSSEECFAAYSRVRGAAFLARGSEHVICAGLREGGKDACLGDSGGPLMLKTTDDRWVIVGIVSLGYKCAEPGYPGVYTRVTHYMNWIQTNMKRY